MHDDRDAEQIRRAARGDRAAQAALVRRYMPAVHALAYRMLADRAEAEDVTQETFLRAWKVLPDWAPRARLSTWLHRVALNLCFDRLRQGRLITLAEPPDRPDPGADPATMTDQAQRVARIERALAELPERQKAALALCALEGHTNIEAAEILQVSVEALESLLARARRRMRARLMSGPEDENG